MQQHQNNVENQFGPRANAYVASVVHSTGADLERIEAIASEVRPRRAVDLGCGGGHVAYRMAPHAEAVVAADLSSSMLDAVMRTAKEKGLTNISVARTSVERLPFGTGEFDFLGCRFSAHHWRDFDLGIREARRVLQTASRAVFIDVVSSADPLFNTHLQAIELLRDTSHVRNYTLGEWSEHLGRSHFAIERLSTWRMEMEFESWTARMATPEHFRTAIRELQISASEETRRHFEIRDDGSFMLDMAMFEVRAI